MIHRYLRGPALPFAILALALRAACCATLAAEAAKPAGAPAIAMHGGPALNDHFDHLPYADPAALKGGR
ncbi:MAG: ABC transporter substrate-binding protein, partial [Methylocella sp.]